MRARVVICAAALVGLGLLAAAPLISDAPVVVYNGSPSAPLGFYRIRQETIDRGDLVLARPPQWADAILAGRGYLPPRTPILKSVVALGGDEVCRWSNDVFVNRKRIAGTLAADAAGRPMPSWFGCRVLEEGQYFLMQRHERSFDSRYVGAIDASFVLGVARLIRAD